MTNEFVVIVGVTSRGRATIAAQFLPVFFTQFHHVSQDAEQPWKLGGIGSLLVVGSRKYDFSFGNPA